MKAQLKLQVINDKTQEKQKKIKPLKQPAKQNRPPKLLNRFKNDDSGMKMSQKDKNTKNSKIGTIIVPHDDHKINNKELICTDLLQKGYVQSFIDIFYISHKCLPNVMKTKNYIGQNIHVSEQVDEDENLLQSWQNFSQDLTKVEIFPDSLREHKENSMNQYNSIAFNYEDQDDYINAAYFYGKVITLAISCQDKQFQLAALLGLGKCYEHQHHSDEAIDILEGAFSTASTLSDNNQKIQMTKIIGKQLIQIYIKKAEYIVKFDVDQALESYRKGLGIAQRANESESQARISHKIGKLYYEQNKYDLSIKYQEEYKKKLKEAIEEDKQKEGDENAEKKDLLSLKLKEMEANASLAKNFLKLKDIHKAQQHLNEYHQMAKDVKAQNSVADSSYYLAKLFEEKGEDKKAMLYYQLYFEAAKSQKQDKKDRKLVDKSRVTYAIAKTKRNMDKYIGLFNDDNSLRTLLDWKIKKVLK